jgi:outer membrane receptor protein involved in Fe transport
MSKGIFHATRARLLCGAGIALALCAPAAAQQVESVVVTGSRLPSTYQAPTPVTVVDASAIKLSGNVNIEDTLNETPQFRGSQGDGKFNNGQGAGGATLNLRGLGAQRNLVLVNGRRYTIQGPDQTTDVNTIPTALIQRTEIVTGGSSAVYGSDAITGVINFIMRQDFEGVEAQTHVDFDSVTATPTYSIDLTAGANFARDKGNIAVSMGYQNRGGISRQDRGGIYIPPYGDGCVTAATASPRQIGTQINLAAGQTCAGVGGKPGLVFAGSGDIPNGRYVPQSYATPGGANAALNTAYANAGLAGLTGNNGFGYTYDNGGTTARPAVDPTDRYNLTLPNYLQVPQERWMINSFMHYDLLPRVTAYAEMHFSNNSVTSRLSPSNINSTMFFNDNNPYLTPAMQTLFTQMDAAEPAAGVNLTAGSKTYKTTPGDGIAALTVGRRFTDVGFRIANSQRDAYRFVGGFRGTLPSVSDSFLKDLSYDVYYDYAKTTNTERQQGSVSRSRLQDALLSVGGAAPVCNIFGQNISTACVTAIAVNSTTVTTAQMAGAQGSVTGTLFDMPAGAVSFALGGEWRSTAAVFVPDQFLASGDVAGFNAALPTRGSESVREVFGEVRVPLIKDAPLIQELSLNGAFRNSDYNLSGVGDVWTYSAGADWKLDDNISFRGQYQSAIRAPNVGELFGGQTQNFTAFTDPCAQSSNSGNAKIRTICLAQGVPAAAVFTPGVQPAALVGNVSGGNPALSQEQSETITFGSVITPNFVPGLALSVDWFSIGINGAIAQLGGGLVNTGNLCYNTLQDANSIYCRAFNRDPNSGAITAPLYVQVNNANTGAMKTQGVDFAGQYHFDLDWGYLSDSSSVSISTNWTWTTEFTLTPVKELSNIKNECVGAFGTTCGSPIPSLKGTSRVTWTDGDLSLSLRHRYVGGTTVDTYLLPFRSVATTPSLATLTNPVIPDFHYFDLSGTYDLTDEIQLAAGVNNLLNVGPPILGSAANGNVTFPATYDPMGQSFFFDVTFKTN